MKYIRVQKIVKKICDENVEDQSMISKLLQTIKERDLFCSLVLEKNYNITYCPKARILDVQDDKFFYRNFVSRATVKDSALIGELKELKVETEIETITKKKDKDSRWVLLDLEEEKDESN